MLILNKLPSFAQFWGTQRLPWARWLLKQSQASRVYINVKPGKKGTRKWFGICKGLSGLVRMRFTEAINRTELNGGDLMASSILNTKISGFASVIPIVISRKDNVKAIYEQHQNRIYNLAFYLTDSEMTAEQVSTRVFSDVFAYNRTPSAEVLDCALVGVVREMMPIGDLSLSVPPATEAANVRGNVKRAVLERAVMQVPATERLIFLLHDVEGYDHSKIARILGISTEESRNGLHQARLAVRRAVATIKF
jgi:RNA polymerase sigma-70 factor, ECF subfamily